MMCYRTKFHKPYSNVSSIIAMKLEVKYTGFDVLAARLMKSEVFGDMAPCTFLYRYRIVG